jgi:hypothetical protein
LLRDSTKSVQTQSRATHRATATGKRECWGMRYVLPPAHLTLPLRP